MSSADKISDAEVEIVARFIVENVFGNSWDGQGVTGRVTERGFKPFHFSEHGGIRCQGTQDDLRDVARNLIGAAAATRRAQSVVVGDGVATHRHVKRGSEYALLGIGNIQSDYWTDALEGGHVDMREVAVYRSVDDGAIWVRPREEFDDGRFTALNAEVDGPKPS